MVIPTYQLNNGGGSALHQSQPQQQPTTLSQPYSNGKQLNYDPFFQVRNSSFFSEVNYDMMTNYNPRSSPIPDGNAFYSNTYRPPSPFFSSQDMNNAYYSTYSNLPLDRMTSSLQTNKINHIKLNKNIKTGSSTHTFLFFFETKTFSSFEDTSNNGEMAKLYCTNLPDNCKAIDLQNLFSPFGHVIDCVILWDYYAFVTFKTFVEAERALHALHGYTWKDRQLIVEWSRASGRRQQQQTLPSPTTPRLGSFGCMFSLNRENQRKYDDHCFFSFLAQVSTPPSPRNRPTTIVPHQSASNTQFFANNSPKILSPLKSQSPHHTFSQNLAMMSMIQQQSGLHHQHHSTLPYATYTNRNNGETLTNENQPIFDG